MENYRTREVREIADTLVDLGFIVYLGKSRTHGFYTDATGERVIGFQSDLGGPRFGGNYQPSHRSGSGWRIETRLPLTKEGALNMLYQNAPGWTGNHNPVYTTAEQHLARYTASEYTLYTKEVSL